MIMLSLSREYRDQSDQSDEDVFADLHAQLVRELPALRERARFLERNDAGAEDLVHDTIEKAMRNWSRFKPGSSLRAWMLRIMQNQFIDGWRHRQYVDDRDPDEVHGATSPRTPEEPRPYEMLDFSDVEQVLRQVRPLLRQAFELAYVHRLPHHEISRQLGVPAITVATRLHRARRLVRTLLMARLHRSMNQPKAIKAITIEQPSDGSSSTKKHRPERRALPRAPAAEAPSYRL
jgi:RNA polymerase sigma-70 factor, ECF subfamily